MSNGQNKGVVCISVDVLEKIIKNTVRQHSSAGPVGIQILADSILNTIKNTNNSHVIDDTGILRIIGNLVSKVEEAQNQNSNFTRMPVRNQLGFTIKTIHDIMLYSYHEVAGSTMSEYTWDGINPPKQPNYPDFIEKVKEIYLSQTLTRITDLESKLGGLDLRTSAMHRKLHDFIEAHNPQPKDISWNPITAPIATPTVEPVTEKQSSIPTQVELGLALRHTVESLEEKVNTMNEKIAVLEKRAKADKTTTKPKVVTAREQMFSSHVGQELEITDKPQKKVKTARPDKSVTRS